MAKIYYLGDSTAAVNGPETWPQTGMSQGLQALTASDVEVVSLAQNGRSTKSFLDEGLFRPAQEHMEQGDLVLIQFGHNDEKEDPLRHTDPDTTFRENLLYFIDQAKARGAYPVLVTPIARRLFDDQGHFLPGSHGAYSEAVRRTGAAEAVPVADLTAITEAYLSGLGEAASRELYMVPVDNTHLTCEGARTMAALLCRELISFGAPYDAFVKQGEA